MSADGRCPSCQQPFDDHKLPPLASTLMGLKFKPTCPPLVTKWDPK